MAKAKRHSYAPSPEQADGVSAILSNPITFVSGPPGTGKSYLAAAMAHKLVAKGEYTKVLVARPAVEAGEKLGSLPGGYGEKIAPFQAPIIELLQEFFLADDDLKHKVDDLIEPHAVAYMRGATFHQFAILDEAQNVTVQQMKMFLTRLGPTAKMVITGDGQQCDLPPKVKSGFDYAIEKLEGTPGIAVVRLTSENSNYRHPLVAEIVRKL